ncbi:VOC family protein [Streptomyces niveus]|uniref:VOC family protein n=1 Tax=Streptomyces niveus TaxID=193462 RepID=UPI00365A53DB
MGLEWDSLVIDAADPVALGRWWRDALGWVVVNETAEESEVRPAPDRMPGLFFGVVPDGRTVKNRLHLDFRPDDQHAEVGQRGDEPWVVLADPEGNEFCVLGERPSG